MVFDWVGNRIMPSHVLVLEVGSPVLSFLLSLNLPLYLLSKVQLVLLLLSQSFLFLYRLKELKLSESLVLLIFLFPFLILHQLLMFKLISEGIVRIKSLLLLPLQMFIMRFVKSLATIIVSRYVIETFHIFFLVIISIPLCVFTEVQRGYINIIDHGRFFFFDSNSEEQSVFLSELFLFLFFFLLKLDSLFELIMVETFVGIQVIKTGVFVYFYFFDEVGVDLGSKDLFMMFGGLKIDSLSLFLISHFSSLKSVLLIFDLELFVSFNK